MPLRQLISLFPHLSLQNSKMQEYQLDFLKYIGLITDEMLEALTAYAESFFCMYNLI